ncbi:hypothetical protein GCM10027570_33300 [Streptomonospora sediminis]
MKTAPVLDAPAADTEFAQLVAGIELEFTAKLDPFSEPDPERGTEPATEPSPAEKETEAPEKESKEDGR